MKPTCVLSLFLCACAYPQDMDMPGMKMPGMQMNDAGMYLMDSASGTSRNPASWAMPMAMRRAGSWNLMFMGQAFIVDTQQSGPRGGDKLYSANAFMFAAEHSLWGGSLMLQSMFSLEPATVTNRSYPLLFQTGETAYGKPLVDAQHPHNFFMALGVQYAHKLAGDSMLQLYYAPVGDPALGPVAFPHRASAAELPQAPIGHHWQDSTHIAANVATVAVRYAWLRLEASGFYGTEPGENRWTIDWGPMNSYAGRASVAPSRNWLFQVSAGRLAHPERQEPGDVTRITSSVEYSRPLDSSGAWSSSVVWGRNHNTFTQHNLNSYLAETVYPLSRRNFLTGRWELVDKDELSVPGIFRVAAYTAGYTRDVGSLPHLETGIGANLTAYTLPDALKPAYGNRPWGVNLYLRVRLKKDSGQSPAAQADRTFTGVITDTMCGRSHTMMAGQPDDKCVAMCVKGSSQYALYDGKTVFKLSDQKTPARFAARRVRVAGTLNEKTATIKVRTMEEEK